MRIETVQKPLRELVRSFVTGKILLPQFQRDYVWKPKKIRNLLDSLLQEFPIGGVYLWKPAGAAFDPKPTKFGVRHNADFLGYLIDGQQRLTSLEAAFGLYTGADKGGVELRCFLDLSATNVERRRDTRLFVSHGGKQAIARRVDAGDPTLVSVSAFFEPLDRDGQRTQDEDIKVELEALRWTKSRVRDAMDRLDSARKMLDQDVPCTTVYDIDDRKAVEVFSRLNKGGTPLKQSDVTAAELARGKAVGVLKKMREYVVTEVPERLGFGFSFAFRALVIFHRGSAQFTSLKEDWVDAPGPRGRSLSESWDAAQLALEAALAFVDQKMGWSRRLLLPSANALIVLAAAFDKADLKPSAQDEADFRRWLCLSALRGVFQGSVETTMNRFLRGVKESRRYPGRALVDALKRDEGRRVRSEELMGGAQLWAPAVQVLHAYLVNQDARDWIDVERTVDILARTDSGKFPGGDLTVHHIFPRKVLADAGVQAEVANRVANFALLSRSTNAEFSDKRPDDVFDSLTPPQRKAAEKQFFSGGAGDRLKPERFEQFCEWRAGELADALNEFLGID